MEYAHGNELNRELRKTDRLPEKQAVITLMVCTIKKQETYNVRNSGLFSIRMVENKAHDYAVDNWTLGIICYEFLYGVPQFEVERQANTFRRQILPTHPYVPDEITRASLSQSLQNANDNHAFVQKAKAEAKDKVTQDLYAICVTSYELLTSLLQDSIQALAKKDYNGLENSLLKCPRLVSACQNALGSKTTPEMLDRSRKQFDLVLMAKIAEGLIQKLIV
ncbi:hypothetical protein RDI58_010275 [Solanum bulbocastanum]|uniref:Uncharacterized protein n=1 Tax=Solanum bulbocastanum TaxID=147425 RepID=A0AAN8TQP6_SOLBU